MSVTRWIFGYGTSTQYTFSRNPDRYGGDTGWLYEPKMTMFDIIGANAPAIQIDGFNGAQRVIKFTAITGTMTRTLQDFFLRKEIVNGCRDHLYPTHPAFSCFITNFVTSVHPTSGSFPGSGEDTYDVEITLIKMS